MLGGTLSVYWGRREMENPVPAESLVITRDVAEERGVEMFVPNRFLKGLLPEQLLEEYVFWQQQSGVNQGQLVGELKQRDSDRPQTALLVHFPVGDKHRSHARVYREVIGSQDSPLELLNISLAAADSNLSSLAALCKRLEAASHALVWGRNGHVVVVEFPRLQLSFTDRNGKMVCDQHDCYWLARRDDGISRWSEALLKEFIGATALLCGEYGTRAILCSAGLKAGRVSVDRSCDGLLVRRDRWI